MQTSTFRQSIFTRIIVAVIAVNFILTSGPVNLFAADHLRLRATKDTRVQANLGEDIKNAKKDGGISAAQEAITLAINSRDTDYLKAVNSSGTAKLVSRSKTGAFIPGHDLYQSLRKAGKSAIAVNVLSFNQIEGHLRAAKDLNAVIIFEVARSQIGYALNEQKVVEYIREVLQANPELASVPIIVHGDHTQYTQDLFEQKTILKAAYEKKYGEGSFKDTMQIQDIDTEVLKSVRKTLSDNIVKERQAISDIIERLIKAGFTSIAIDASTLYDEVAGDAVMDYYSRTGSAIEKMIVDQEKGFAFPLEWGVDFLKFNPEKQKKEFLRVRNKVVSDMTVRNRPAAEVSAKEKEMETAFGALYKEAKKAGLDAQTTIAAYDRIMTEIAQATIAGRIPEKIYNTLSDQERMLLLPSSNAAETAYQLKMIDQLLEIHNPALVGHMGKEIEVGHVDKKAPNPRRGGKMEAKLTHPAAVKVMGEYLQNQGLAFDLIATNNGSGHGTEFNKETLTPVSQVGKISPFLTQELQREAAAVSASIVQHGTSGSDMEELADLSHSGILKFNIATNYQQIILNVLSLIDDGLTGKALMAEIVTDASALTEGLAEPTRAKIQKIAAGFKDGTIAPSASDTDSLFMKFMKVTYAWGVKKSKIKTSSSKEEIATVFAKEFKRAFKDMDQPLYELSKDGGIVDLQDISGLPILLNEQTGELVLGQSIISEGKWKRPMSDLSPSNESEAAITKDPNRIVYYGYRNVGLKTDRKALSDNKLRYDITVLLPGVIDKKLDREFIMTKGHQHPTLGKFVYPEIYEVWNGKAIYMQQHVNAKTKKIDDVFVTFAQEGDKVVLLPNYSHRTINVGDVPLVMANWISREVGGVENDPDSLKVKPNFADIEAKRGYAYRVKMAKDGKIEFDHNFEYGMNPAPLRLAIAARAVPSVKLVRGLPMYDLIRDPKAAANLNVFLTEAKGFDVVFKDAFQYITMVQAQLSLNVKDGGIDSLVKDIILSTDAEKKMQLNQEIRELAKEKGVFLASVFDLYMAMGRGEVKGFTVPAINLRGMTYDLAREIFRVAKKHNSGAFVFEIAKSEIGYTAQSPAEYAAVVLAAAVKEGYTGPVFIQGDHYQVNAKKYYENPKKEIDGLKAIIKESIEAGFYNIDIDASTIVDLKKPTLELQQDLNARITAELTQYARSIQPRGVMVSVGGELGEVGKENTKPEELDAFMTMFNKYLPKEMVGLSKISVQTGTKHGGIVLPDGTVAQVKIDFETLGLLSKVAREKYGMAGAVQHGASTLPDSAFNKFFEVGAAEVHLATGFQNIIYDSKNLPATLKADIYKWIAANLKDERKADQTDEQFYYETRKKGFGPFKAQFLNMNESTKSAIAAEVGAKFDLMFTKMNTVNNRNIVIANAPEKRVTRIGILTGGGPASGHNEVIYSAQRAAAALGIELVVIWEGWKGLIDDKLVSQARPLTVEEVEAARTHGGTILKTSRENPFNKEGVEKGKPQIVWENIQKLQLDGLMTLGGDDTNGVTAQLQQQHPEFMFVGLPKTMDNDIALPEYDAKTYGFISFVKAAAAAVKAGIVDAKATKRVLVVEAFGRSAGYVAAGIGAEVEASRTLIPEEELDLEQLVKDLIAYFKVNKYGSVIISEGVKINKDYKNNAAMLEAGFKADKTGLARVAFENAMNAGVDAFGHPKLENAGLIISAVLKAGFEPAKISISQAGKVDYLFRSADTAEEDMRMTGMLGKAAVENIVKGVNNQLLYVYEDEVRSIPFTQKLGGRQFDYQGADKAQYLKANQALGMAAADGGTFIPTQRDIVQATYNDIVDRYRDLEIGQYLTLSKDEMEAILWTVNDMTVANGDTLETYELARRILNRLTEEQKTQLIALSGNIIFNNHGLAAKVADMLQPVNIFVNAGNALIHRAGGFGLFMQQNYEPGMRISAIKSLKGPKGLTAKQFVEENFKYTGVFLPYHIKNLHMGKPVEVNGLSIDTIIVPADKNINRPEQQVLYFNPDITIEQALDAMRALNERIDIVADYGPVSETQAARLKVLLDQGYRVVAASPVSTASIKEMLENSGYGSAALKEGLFAINRKTIGFDTLILDSLTCTSNATIAVAGAIHRIFGIVKGNGLTVHADTDSNTPYPQPSGRDRNPLDKLRGVPMNDNIIPASTGAADNFFKIYPELKGKFDITAMRVDVLEGSMWKLDITVSRDVTLDEVRAALRDWAKKESGSVVQYYGGTPDQWDAPLFSAKIVGWPSISIIDDKLISLQADRRTITIQGFYDNQSAAPNQMISRWAPWMVSAVRLQNMVNGKSGNAAPVAVAMDGGSLGSRELYELHFNNKLKNEVLLRYIQDQLGVSADKMPAFDKIDPASFDKAWQNALNKFTATGEPKFYDGFTVIGALPEGTALYDFYKEVYQSILGVNKALGRMIIAPVDLDSVHMTFYDLVAMKEWESKYNQMNPKMQSEIQEKAKTIREEVLKSLGLKPGSTGRNVEKAVLMQAVYEVVVEKTATVLRELQAEKVFTKAPVFKPMQLSVFNPGGPSAVVLSLEPATADDIAIVAELQRRIQAATGIANFPDFRAHMTLGYLVDEKFFSDEKDYNNVKDQLIKINADLKKRAQGIQQEWSKIDLSYFPHMNTFIPVTRLDLSNPGQPVLTPMDNFRVVKLDQEKKYADQYKDLQTPAARKLGIEQQAYLEEIRSVLGRDGFMKFEADIKRLESFEQEWRSLYNNSNIWNYEDQKFWDRAVEIGSLAFGLSKTFQEVEKKLAKASVGAQNFAREFTVRASIVNNADTIYMTQKKQLWIVPLSRIVQRQVGASTRFYASFVLQMFRPLGFGLTEAENPKDSRQTSHMHAGNTERTYSGSDVTRYIDYNTIFNQLKQWYSLPDKGPIIEYLLGDMLYEVDRLGRTEVIRQVYEPGVAKDAKLSESAARAIFDDYITGRFEKFISAIGANQIREKYIDNALGAGSKQEKFSQLSLALERAGQLDLLWRMSQEVDIERLETDYSHYIKIPQGWVVQTPPGYAHTLRNSSDQVVGVDWTLKDLFLQLFKMAGSQTTSAQFKVVAPEKTIGTGWELYSNKFTQMVAEVETDTQGNVVFEVDENGVNNPKVKTKMNVRFDLITVAKKDAETLSQPFQPLQKNVQMLRLMPWPGNLGDSWNMKSDREKIKASVTVYRKEGSPEIVNLVGGEQLIMNNNVNGSNPIVGYKVKNTSDDNFEIMLVTPYHDLDSELLEQNIKTEMVKNISGDILKFFDLADLDRAIVEFVASLPQDKSESFEKEYTITSQAHKKQDHINELLKLKFYRQSGKSNVDYSYTFMDSSNTEKLIGPIAGTVVIDMSSQLTKDKKDGGEVKIKVAVIGGTGNIGLPIVNRLKQKGQVEVLVGSRTADPSRGIMKNEEAAALADIVIITVPAKAFRTTVTDIAPLLKQGATVLSIGVPMVKVDGEHFYVAPVGYDSAALEVADIIKQKAPDKDIKVVSAMHNVPGEWHADPRLDLNQQIVVLGDDQKACSFVCQNVIEQISDLRPVIAGGLEKSVFAEALTPQIINSDKELLAEGSRSLPELVQFIEKNGVDVDSAAVVAFNREKLDPSLVKKYNDASKIAADIATIIGTKQSRRQKELVMVGLNRYAQIVPEDSAVVAQITSAVNFYKVSIPDSKMFSQDASGFDSVVDELANVKNIQGAIVVGAHTILENAGALTSLLRVKESGANIKIAVWADNVGLMNSLKAMGIEAVADVISSKGAKDVLTQLSSAKIPSDRIVMLHSDLDQASFTDGFSSLDAFYKKFGQIKIVRVSTGVTAVGQQARLNAMPLAVLRAVAAIFSDQASIGQKFSAFAKGYLDNQKISSSDYQVLTDLTKDLVDVPLINVEDEIVKIQTAYEEAINKI